MEVETFCRKFSHFFESKPPQLLCGSFSAPLKKENNGKIIYFTNLFSPFLFGIVTKQINCFSLSPKTKTFLTKSMKLIFYYKKKKKK